MWPNEYTEFTELADKIAGVPGSGTKASAALLGEYVGAIQALETGIGLNTDGDLLAGYASLALRLAASPTGVYNLNGGDLIIDADGDSYLHSAGDNIVDLMLAGASGEFAININAVEDFTFTANAFNVLVGSGIVMGDGCTIGQAAGPLLTFDDTSDYLLVSGCKVGIGTVTPATLFEIESTTTAILSISNTTGGTTVAPVEGVLQFRGYNNRPLGEIRVEDQASDRQGGWMDLRTADASDVMQDRVRIDRDGLVGINIAAPLAQLHVDQSATDGAIPVLSLDQADLSDGFINFIGTSAASAVGPISSWTTGGAITGFYRIEINGAQYWAPYYTAPSS